MAAKSNEITTESIGRGQSIMRAFPLNNLKEFPMESSLKDKGGFGGSCSNLRHSLVGASAVDEGTGAA